jgi:hypothetical protein
MSERNVELMRGLVEAYNARDADAAIAYCDPRGEFPPLLSATVGGAVYHGHEGVAHRQDALRDLGVTEDELEPIDPLADLGLAE